LNGCATITKTGNTPAIDPDAFAVADNVLTIDLAKETSLSQVGGCAKIKHSDIPDGIIIVRTDSDRFAIASSLCTHRGVELEYDHAQNRFKCPSLGASTFSMNGKNTGGPAKKSLKSYEASLRNDILTIRL
jgi:Rieske Fe-S protein